MDISKIFLDGLILSAFAAAFILVTMWVNPRIWLQDYPEQIQSLVPPKTDSEKKLSLALGVPFLALLIGIPLLSTLNLEARQEQAVPFIILAAHAFGILFIFNLFDWLVVDWLLFCTITPPLVILPGSEGAEGYQDYRFHFQGFLTGTVFSGGAGLIIGFMVLLL